MKVTVTLSKNFGAVGTLTISTDAEGVPMDTSLVTFDQLTEQINKMFEHYVTTYGVKMRVDNLVPDVKTVWMQMDSIGVTMKDGKRYYRVKGGQYSEHGIPFYPEHMMKCGFAPTDIPDEGYTFKGATDAEIEFSGDKPKRVLGLRKHVG